MSDGSLLVFGCGVSFVALAGAYVFLRDRWGAHAEETQRVPQAGREPALPPRAASEPS